MAAAGLLAGCAEFLVERAGVVDVEFRFDRRDAGEDILKFFVVWKTVSIRSSRMSQYNH